MKPDHRNTKSNRVLRSHQIWCCFARAEKVPVTTISLWLRWAEQEFLSLKGFGGPSHPGKKHYDDHATDNKWFRLLLWKIEERVLLKTGCRVLRDPLSSSVLRKGGQASTKITIRAFVHILPSLPSVSPVYIWEENTQWFTELLKAKLVYDKKLTSIAAGWEK